MPTTARPYFGSTSRIVWPPARIAPAARTCWSAPEKTAATVSVESSSGNAAIESARSGEPPIAKMSLSAFVAAMRPNNAGSSTSGGKKSSVNTSARSSSSLYTAASSAGSRPTSRSSASTGTKPLSSSSSRAAEYFAAQPPPTVRLVRLAVSTAFTVGAMAGAALVTGGSSGIGLAIARMLRDEGFELTLVSRRAERIEAAAAELGAAAVAADVAEAEECTRVVVEHRDRFGRLDVLVNSAGIGIGGRVEDLPVKHYDLQLAVNLRGLFLVTQAAIPLLRESRGWVVNLASIAGTLPTPGLATYGATKAAVIALTRSLNDELDADGVRAIALCPGFVDTPMAQWSGIEPDEMIRPEDCAEVVRMCLRLSPHARVPQVVIERMGSTNGDVH